MYEIKVVVVIKIIGNFSELVNVRIKEGGKKS